jgi:hypothetical protein
MREDVKTKRTARLEAKEALGVCLECPKRARPGRQLCMTHGERSTVAHRGGRIELKYRCSLCGSQQHNRQRCDRKS